MLALASTSHGYQGRGDFALESDGRIRRKRVEQEIVPFAFTGVSIAHPRLFDGQPGGRLLAQQGVEPGDRCGPRLWRAHGRRVDARRHAGGAGRSRAVPERRCSRSESGRGHALAQAQRIYTVPPGRPFLTALADALLTGALPVPGGARPGPLQLADTTLLLPTRRATRALQDAFLEAAGGTALLLPKIRPIIGAAEEDLGALASADDLATDAAGELRPGDQRHGAAAGARQADHGVVRGGGRHPHARRRRPSWRASSPG